MYSYEEFRTIRYEQSNTYFRYLMSRKLVKFNQCIRTCKGVYTKG